LAICFRSRESTLRCVSNPQKQGLSRLQEACVHWVDYLSIDPKQAHEAAAAFTGDILPKIQSAPGFKSGYWVDPVDGQDFGFLIFETEMQAIAATLPKADWSTPGVSILRTEVRRVAVSLP
jgi:hypothetical protein